MDALLVKAWDCLEQDDVGAARALLGQWQKDHAAEPEILLLQAACDRAEGHLSDALAVLDQLHSLDSEWATPPLWSAEILAEQAEADPENALDLLRKARKRAGLAVDLTDDEDEFLDAVLVKADIEVELDMDDAARETLSALPPVPVLVDTPEFALEVAVLYSHAGDDAAARALAQGVIDKESDPAIAADAWYLLGTLAARAGDDAARNQAWIKVRDLDEQNPDDHDLGVSEDEMIKVAEAALQELPSKARALLQNVPILVADLPPSEDVQTGLDPRILGLFAGTPRTEDSVLGPGEGLKQILLFRLNLQRSVDDAETLKDEIRTTLLHETGHFFGLDEDQLDELGLG